MSTATVEAAKPLSPLAVRLNEHLKAQTPTGAPTLADRCDSCPQPARSVFMFSVAPDPDGTGAEAGGVYLCAHHIRRHIGALIGDRALLSFWVEPVELSHFDGVDAPRHNAHKSGDGLTDA
ncbi:DUF7455 domain-containing protein [Sinomonas atrocyanea]